MSLLTNLISHWKLNEASGTRNDSHSTNHLTDNNTVASTTGKIGDAALFVAANNEWLSIADNAALSTGEVSFGCAFWVNLTTTATQIIIAKDGLTSGSREWAVAYDTTISRFKFWTGRSGSATVDEAVANNFGAASAGVWYLVTCWFDQPTGTLRISVNNGTADTATRTGTIPDSGTAFQIGRYATNTTIDANAAIDSVSFWKGGYPSAGEWTQLYNSGTGLDYESFGTASGAITGISTLTFGQLGTLNGAGSMAGSSTLTFTPAGTMVLAGSIEGSSTLTFSLSATLLATGEIAGSIALTFGGTGALAGDGSMSATSTLTFAAVGTMTMDGALAGSSTLTFSQSATLTASGTITGLSTLTFSVTGVLTGEGDGSMSGTTTLSFSQAGELAGAGSLAGGITLTFSQSGTLTDAGSISGTTTLTLTVSGTLTGTGTPEPPEPPSACDPYSLMHDARCFGCLTEDQRAIGILSLWCQIVSEP